MTTTCLQNAAKIPAPSALVSSGPPLQRKCGCGGSAGVSGECESCDQKKLSLQRSSQESGRSYNYGVPSIVHEVLRSAGEPLDAKTRNFFEPRFGHDFSRVRVHADANAAASARAVNALAYRSGATLPLRPASMRSQLTPGRKLLAHELAQWCKQRAGAQAASQDLAITDPNDSAEREADSFPNGLVSTSQSQPAYG